MDYLPAKLEQIADEAEGRDDYKKALVYYRLALEMNPVDIGLLRHFAKMLERTDDSTEAISIWHEILRISPEDSEAIEHIEVLNASTASLEPELDDLAYSGKQRQWFLIPILLLALILGWFGHAVKGNYYPEFNEETAVPSQKLYDLAHKLALELPEEIEVHTKGGGLILAGPVRYPWNKQALEDKARKWECTFVDMTGIRVEKPHAVRYQVKQGDSLYSLARIFLGRPEMWPVFYDANRDIITDPDRLAVGQTIVLYTEIP
jgi:tetratricopeptide (TPR) repeat protein